MMNGNTIFEVLNSMKKINRNVKYIITFLLIFKL